MTFTITTTKETALSIIEIIELNKKLHSKTFYRYLGVNHLPEYSDVIFECPNKVDSDDLPHLFFLGLLTGLNKSRKQ